MGERPPGDRVFRLFSRDGKITGVANLSGRPHFEKAAPWISGKPIAGVAVHRDGQIAFAPRSVTLFEK